MVYVFFVQPGDMVTFENEVSIMQSVQHLKQKIQEKIGVHVDNQVLLISGGESLESKKNLCSYVAGTDTNPIYLFSTNYELSELDFYKNLYYDDKEIRQRLSDCMQLPASLSTVVTRAQLALDCSNLAQNHFDFCEKLVHDQHLQQQGWSAVIANLEDILSEFNKRADLFLEFYRKFIAAKETYNEILQHFPSDKVILQRIPIIDILLDHKDDTTVSQEGEQSSAKSPLKNITLYDWISSNGKKNSLEELHEGCKHKLKKVEDEIIPSLEKRIIETLQSGDKVEKREIEGLSKRLCDLDGLLLRIKKCVENLSNMAQSFHHNQIRVSNIQDTSILSDLCATHVQQLEFIKQFYLKLSEDRNKVVRAKYELSKSLSSRINWVQSEENNLSELDVLLVYMYEHLQSLQKHVLIFQQVHMSPTTYVNAVVEVVRRRAFSQDYITWASDLACGRLIIRNEELARRKEFNAQFEGHFLTSLFPGMEDLPPTFATEAPEMFDAKLPELTVDDIEKLRKALPDFSEILSLPDLKDIDNFFNEKKGPEDKMDNAKAVDEKLIEAVTEAGLSSDLDKNLLKATSSESCLISAHGLPNLKTDKGCESETDTEEFEKVGQSPVELNFPQQATSQTPTLPDKQDMSTSTEVKNIPPKKPPRAFYNKTAQSCDSDPIIQQHTLSTSTNENFTNIKNSSLESIDELSSIKNFTSISESCFNSHHRQSALAKDQSNIKLNLVELSNASSLKPISLITTTTATSHHHHNSNYHYLSSSSSNNLLQYRSKSVSPQSPPKDNTSPFQETLILQMGHNHQQQQDFVNDEFYIDESLPSSIGTGNSQGSEFVRQLDTANFVVAMLQDNLQISKSEYENLKQTFRNTGELAKKEISIVRNGLTNVKNDVTEQLQLVTNLFSELRVKMATIENENTQLQKYLEQSYVYNNNLLAKIRTLENDKKALNDEKQKSEQELIKLKEDISHWQSKHDNLLSQSTDFSRRADETLKELVEQHKNEIENIKSRFKLMMTEKSGSTQATLEKEKMEDFLKQVQEFFEIEKENAIREERQRCQEELEQKLKDTEDRIRGEGNFILQEAIQDYKKELEIYREREQNLNTQIEEHENTITQLLSENGNNSFQFDEIKDIKMDEIKEKEELLELQTSLIRTTTTTTTTTTQTSPAAAAASRAESTNLSRSSSIYEGSKSDTSKLALLSIDGCRNGDLVLVLWDAEHVNFKILQESRHMYFLHSDSLDSLGLTVTDSQPNKIYCTGQVIDKEYCHARKSKNRYNVPKGTKFFRVKLKSNGNISRDLSQLPPPSLSSSVIHQSRHTNVSELSTSVYPVIEETPTPTLADDSEAGNLEFFSCVPIEQSQQPTKETQSDDTIIEREELNTKLVERTEREIIEDSGIVEEAMAATEEVDVEENVDKTLKDSQEISNRCEKVCEEVALQKSNITTSNWFETMFRSMFSKE